ncbi:MSCRAMM family adhesin SdrC [Streptomyces purpurogeneiscleroticus]|uniref:MSCRAMM family adhesin SdrC n=1 Tax=Streptomyces purpurogeneiscleroticus TaxID=68259 RepID=UPI001CBCCAC7|nr:MSCRAMM family adhesin SdrC [Streptomyces purpurogeneiscleroticus]MBZ4018859.1 hypothetical protein [Streptomyces purpurogeneiscleroticus]
MDDRTESKTKKTGKEKRIDLSLAQVSGSALAAAVAAYLAGRLGVYGTVIGAGVVSVVATTGGSIFHHLFRRTGEQVKEATVSTRPRPRRRQELGSRMTAPGTGARGATRVRSASSAGVTMVLPTFDRGGTEDEITSVAAAKDADATRTLPRSSALDSSALDETQVLTAASPAADDTQILIPPGAEDATRPVPQQDTRTMALRTVTEPPGGASVAETPDETPEGEFRTLYGTRLRGRRRTLLAALAVFLLAMAGVTAFELATGHDAAGSNGTSVSNFFRSGGDSAPTTPTPQPSTSTEDTDRGGATEGPTPQPDATDGSADSGSDAHSGADSGSDTGSGSDDESTAPSPSPSDGDESADPTPTPTDGGDDGASSSPDAGSGTDDAQDAGQTPAPGSS